MEIVYYYDLVSGMAYPTRIRGVQILGVSTSTFVSYVSAWDSRPANASFKSHLSTSLFFSVACRDRLRSSRIISSAFFVRHTRHSSTECGDLDAEKLLVRVLSRNSTSSIRTRSTSDSGFILTVCSDKNLTEAVATKGPVDSFWEGG